MILLDSDRFRRDKLHMAITQTTPRARDRLIQVARDLFYRDGVRNVGLDAILTGAGVTKTTFYNHFESKDDLVIAVLRKHDSWWRDVFSEHLRKHGGHTPRGQLCAIFDALEELLLNSDTFNGCLFVNVAVEFPNPHDPVHQVATEHKRGMHDLLARLAGYAGAADPDAFAAEMSMLMEGAYVTHSMNKGSSAVEIARSMARMVVQKHLGARSIASSTGDAGGEIRTAGSGPSSHHP